jgi:hypothetical protein
MWAHRHQLLKICKNRSDVSLAAVDSIAGGSLHSAENARKIFTMPRLGWASRYRLFAAGTSLKWISHIILALSAETRFLRFKEQVHCKFKNEISAVQP